MVNTTAPRLTLAQRRELEAFGERAGRFGVNFAIVGPSGQIETLLSAGEFESDTQQIMDAAGHVLGAAQTVPRKIRTHGFGVFQTRTISQQLL